MPLNLMNGLMAGANFGQGYLQGQQTANQLAYQGKMQQLSLDDAQLRLQQEQRDAKMQQDLSDRAMMRWQAQDTAQAPPVSNPTDPNMQMSNLAGAPQQVGVSDQDINNMVSDARDAMARGDVVHGNQLFTNATNMQNARFEQQQHQAAGQLGELKRQQAHYEMAAQFASTMPDTPEGFNQWKMMVLADPSSSPQERTNVANMQYRPGIMDTIRDSGMNASQAATARMKDLEFQEKQRVNDLQEAHRLRQDTEKEQYDSARIAAMNRNTKVGAIDKAPSSTEMKSAVPLIAQTLGLEETDPILSAPDPNSPSKFTQATPAVIGVVSQAKQLMSGNRALTFPQAVAMAAQQAKANGEFPTQTTTEHHLFGTDTTSNKTSYKNMGMTQENPIDLSTIKNRDQLIKGRWYKMGDKIEQWQG